jgi:hypothetical protein
MRKIIGVLVGVALVLMVGSAEAVNNGTGDPLGLIASGAIQPFWAADPDSTLIEVTSPLDDNDLHVIYFNASCTRLISRSKSISRKGAIVISADADIVGLGPAGQTPGLAVIASTQVGLELLPIPNAGSIHVRGFWINAAADFVRVVDPIAVSSPDSLPVAGRQTYSPLRSAASFGAPQDVAPFSTFIFLICPNTTVYNTLPVAFGFPAPPVVATSVFGFLYDDDENFLLDFTLACNCLSMYQLSTISPLYGTLSPSGLTYTELVTYNTSPGFPAPVCPNPDVVACNPPAFTGYRAISVIGALDGFGRLANGAAYNYRVNGDEHLGMPPAPLFAPGIR